MENGCSNKGCLSFQLRDAIQLNYSFRPLPFLGIIHWENLKISISIPICRKIAPTDGEHAEKRENVREQGEERQQDPRRDELRGDSTSALAGCRHAMLLQQIYLLLAKACSFPLPKKLGFLVDKWSWGLGGASPIL